MDLFQCTNLNLKLKRTAYGKPYLAVSDALPLTVQIYCELALPHALGLEVL